MILYSLVCVGEHEFEAWFSNSDGYDKQQKRHLIECPECGSTDIRKQIMAPAVKDSGDKRAKAFAQAAGEIRKHIAETHDYVGDGFADEARAMFYGEAEHRPVWGEVTPDTAEELREEGVPALPLPKAFAPEAPKRRKEVN